MQYYSLMVLVQGELLSSQTLVSPTGQEQPFDDPSAQTGAFFEPAQLVAPVETVRLNGVHRSEEPSEQVALAGLRRSLSVLYNIPMSLPQRRFFQEALAAAAWNHHELIRDLIEEVDTNHLILGVDFSDK